MRSDLFVYLAGPLTGTTTHTVEQNCALASHIYFECIRRHLPAFCPHLGVIPSAFEIAYETWMQYDFAIIERATHVMLLPRWRESTGARRERDYARALPKPVVVYDDLPADWSITDFLDSAQQLS